MRRGLAVGVWMGMAVGIVAGGWVTDWARADDLESVPVVFKYTPPKLGMPGARIGGGSRGKGGEGLEVAAIVPDQVALSARPDPSFCWHQARTIKVKRALIIDDGQSLKPIMEQVIDVPNQAGIQCVRLDRFGVLLKPEVEYRWFIDAIPDSEHRSKDVVSGGAVLFRRPAAGLTERIKGTSGHDLAPLLAANGYWYDAVESVITGIEAHPGDRRYQTMKGELLIQAGLPQQQ